MTTSSRLHEHGVRSSRRRYRNREDFEQLGTFKWRCAACGTLELTPKPATYAEDDWTEPPEHCGQFMEAVE